MLKNKCRGIVKTIAASILILGTTINTVPLFAAETRYTLDTVNLRSQANTESDVLYTVEAGKQITVTGYGADGWIKVDFDGMNGFIKSEYIGSQNRALAGTCYTLDNVNLRSGRSVNSKALTMIKSGTPVNLTGYNADGWCSVIYNGTGGFIRSEYIGTQNQALAGTYYTLDNVNLRSGASVDSGILKLIDFGTAVKITEYNPDGWSKVYYDDSQGFIKTEYIGTQGQTLAGTYYALSNVNIRSGASTGSEVLKKIELGTEITITEYNVDGWSKVNFGDIKGFMKSEYIGTKKQLEAAKEESGSSVELTPWNEARNVFEIGVPAKVYDVYSGRTYYVKSFSNGNHADVEPITTEDTATMKKTFGGVWSWDVRPVWVSINGKTMAASINGMPHGGGVNGSNGMNGQVCIHFKGSSTHNGNASFTRLHQNKAYEAYNLSN